MAELEICTKCGGKLDGVQRHPDKHAWILSCPKCDEFEISDADLSAWKHLKNLP